MLLGMNAHINFDLPQSLVRDDPAGGLRRPRACWRCRRRDHERIDGVLAARVAEEDVALQRAGGRRTALDRVLAPANRTASRLFLRESRRKVWANAARAARGAAARPRRLRRAGSPTSRRPSAARVRDLLRPGPVLLRLAVRGFGVTLA